MSIVPGSISPTRGTIVSTLAQSRNGRGFALEGSGDALEFKQPRGD
jgi:hypothetical protein